MKLLGQPQGSHSVTHTHARTHTRTHAHTLTHEILQQEAKSSPFPLLSSSSGLATGPFQSPPLPGESLTLLQGLLPFHQLQGSARGLFRAAPSYTLSGFLPRQPQCPCCPLFPAPVIQVTDSFLSSDLAPNPVHTSRPDQQTAGGGGFQALQRGPCLLGSGRPHLSDCSGSLQHRTAPLLSSPAVRASSFTQERSIKGHIHSRLSGALGHSFYPSSWLLAHASLLRPPPGDSGHWERLASGQAMYHGDFLRLGDNILQRELDSIFLLEHFFQPI